MALKADLENEVTSIFKTAWTERNGTVVPDDTSVKLGTDAVRLKATVLYADMADSTQLVDQRPAKFAAEIYKTFLFCAAKIIRSEGGVITAYDGDRIMAVYIGDTKNTPAVRTALKIKWAVEEIIMPAKNRHYPNNDFQLKHVVGVDTSDLFVARTGVRGANDLVWVGRAANYAAKLSSLPEGYTYITKNVFNGMHESMKVTNGKDMWEPRSWTANGGLSIYRSNWRTSIT